MSDEDFRQIIVESYSFDAKNAKSDFALSETLYEKQGFVVVPYSKRKHCFGQLSDWFRKYITVWLILGVQLFYLVFYLIQESVFKQNGFTYGGAHTLIHFVMFLMISQVRDLFNSSSSETHENNENTHLQGKQWFLIQLAFFNVTGIAFSTYAVNYLNYPTYILLKSSRVVATMIGGIFILKKSFFPIEYVGVGLIAGGMVVFSADDIMKARGEQSGIQSFLIGLTLCVLSLIANAAQDNYQEKGLKHLHIKENDMILYSYGYGVLMLLPFLLINGELVECCKYFLLKPKMCLLIILCGFLSYCGLVCIILLTKHTSAVVTGICTTVRKAFSVILSFLVFGKSLSPFHFIGGITVFGGIALHQSAKAMKRPQPVEIDEETELPDEPHEEVETV